MKPKRMCAAMENGGRCQRASLSKDDTMASGRLCRAHYQEWTDGKVLLVTVNTVLTYIQKGRVAVEAARLN